MPTEQEKQLAEEIKRVYEQAAKETQKKLADFIKGHRVRNQKMLQYVRDGVLSESDYQHWLKGQVFQEKQWKEKVKDVTQIYLEADKKAHDLVNGTAEDVFVDVANHTAYDIEKDFKGGVSFNIYDERTVERLLRDDPQVLPKWKINEPKDYIWNQKRVQNSVLQGIIQGESIAEIGQRLTTELATSNEKKMRLFARTAMTGAQNAGRMQRLRETESMGIEVRKKWLATLDSKTRDAHRDLDGQERKVNENFESDDGEIAYPGDPTAPARLVYNCRCTLTYVYPQYQHLQQNHQRYDQESRKNIDYVTYKEWQRAKQQEQERSEEETATQVARVIAEGQDISETWERRPDQFDFEIEDIINAQGFDGLPRVVSADEFKKCVDESKFVAQRVIRAPDQETIEAYTNELYNGKWYIDCSIGGAEFGQGMYCAANYEGIITNEIKRDIDFYAKARGYGGRIDQNQIAKIETFTLTPDSRIISYSKLEEMAEDIERFKNLEINEFGYKTISNITSIAAELGYDAVHVDLEWTDETIILNRTKVIFRRPD